MEINEKTIMYISAGLFITFLILAIIFIYDPPLYTSFLILSVMLAVVPYSLYRFFEFRLIKNCENEFPNFLRDLAEAKRSSLSLIQAIKNCSKSDYGALTKYVKKMAHQLSWNIPLSDVIGKFRKRFKRSKIMSYAMLIISKIEESGGRTEDILDSLADNIENIKETYAEKASLMQQHVMTMYAIFFIFLGICITLIKFLIPLLQSQGEIGGFGFLGSFGGSPCDTCIGVDDMVCAPCNVYFGFCKLFSFGALNDPACYYKSLFFAMIIIQGIFSGLIAGQISSDSLVAGIKHSLLLTTLGFIIYVTISYIGVV